jgi:8-oxo-dGTP diphosphatase
MTERYTRVAAYARCMDAEDRMLLCRLGPGERYRGWWTLPGGGIEFGERPADAAIRELAEEAGLSGRIVGLLGVDSRVIQLEPAQGPLEMHAIRIVYEVEITGGTLRDEPDGSTDTCAWLSSSEMEAERLVDLVDVARSLGSRTPSEARDDR